MINLKHVNASKKLISLQQELNKNNDLFQENSDYTCEGILKTVKLILNKYICALIISDELRLIGNIYYISAKATFLDCESNEEISNYSFIHQELPNNENDPKMMYEITSQARLDAIRGLLDI